MKGYVSMGEAFNTTGEEVKYLDRFLYRGKGRPRKTDYSSLGIITSELINEHNQYLNDQLFNSKQKRELM